MSQYVTLSRPPLHYAVVAALSRGNGEAVRAITTADIEKAAGPDTVIVLERQHALTPTLLDRFAASTDHSRPVAILITTDPLHEPLRGADVIAPLDALELAMSAPEQRCDASVLSLDRLLSASLLSGQLDLALDSVADALAAGFGVDRCVLSIRGDSAAGAAGGAQTWDSLTWDRTAEHCRAASAAQATLIARTEGGSYESYLAVPLDGPRGTLGFLGLVVSRPVRFARDARAALDAVARRLGSELSWRTAHQRAVDELERMGQAPGQARRLGVWNRVAMNDLARMYVSASKRSGLPLSAVILDVVDLQGVNHRYGLELGDRLLRRMADALTAVLRVEDVVGRWAGDKIAVILHGTPPEAGGRVGERIRAALDARPLELEDGTTIPLAAAIGVAGLGPNEDAAGMFARAARAAKEAVTSGVSILSAAPISVQPRISYQNIEVADELRTIVGCAYRLQHEISRGGMGVVYRAEDLALERPVAIKMLRPDLAEDRGFVEHLRVEAAMLARLQHPNLVQIYSFGQSAGDSYFVMELVEGEGLQQAIERHALEGTRMPLDEVLLVIDEMASALDAIHERGIVHRDVKPGNVIRDPFRNRAVLIDVGIARRYGQFVESAGTPGFVAPEVIAGLDASPRSDVYGLAATAYTLLSLMPPWGVDGDVLGRQCAGAPPPAISTICPEHAAADDVLDAALAADPLHRPATAGQFAQRLRTALASKQAPPAIPPLPATRAPAATRWRGNVVLPSRAVANTRGVVFRSISRALGVHPTQRLRDELGGSQPDLAQLLMDAAPLAWLPTDAFGRLISVASQHAGSDSTNLARDTGRATVRASFRRFFPASAATLVPERTLSAIRNIWGQYQNWGNVVSMPVNASEMVIRVGEPRSDHHTCAWTEGMLEQLVILSGGRTAVILHEDCCARGDAACLFRVSWERA
ncbi:MAG: diguanylate cyclase [Kofleriaceae bacterium]|nr:diguanylate cyclase [Kofleriaceae bacterium]